MADMDGNEILNDPALARAAQAVAGLPRAEPPGDLAVRTMRRISAECQPVKKVVWLLRPITNPIARLAAAAVIIFTLTPMTDLDMAEPLGSGIQNRIIGQRMAERFETFVDRLLVMNGTQPYPQAQLDAFMGVQRPAGLRKPAAARSAMPKV